MRKRSRNLIIGLVIIFVVLIGGSIYFLFVTINNKNSSPIPRAIMNKVSFPIFYPANKVAGIIVTPGSLNYDTSNYAISYRVKINSQLIDVTEQQTPEIFSESGVYDYKLSQAHEFYSFNSSSGDVALTKPVGLNNQTVAWLNSRGTLVLVHALGSLNDNQWQQFFNELVVYW